MRNGSIVLQQSRGVGVCQWLRVELVGLELTLLPVTSPATRPADGALEGLPELEAHDVVEDRVDDGRHVVEDAGDVEEDAEGRLHRVRPVLLRDVDHHETLRVERGPADEEGDHHGN